MMQDTPARLVRVVPNYGKQFAACVTKEAGAVVRPNAVGGPDTVGPVAAVLKSGNYVFAQVLPGSTGVAPSVSVHVFDPHLNLISNKAYPATVYVSGSSDRGCDGRWNSRLDRKYRALRWGTL